MKVLFFSRRKDEETGGGWYRGGTDIAYYPTTSKPNPTYTLSFNFQVMYENDEMYISHWFPYTYTDLRSFLKEHITTSRNDIARKTELTKTSAGNPVEMLIVTNFNSSEADISERKAIIATARVHPGESNSSFIMQGMIRFIISDDPVAQKLRDTFVFKFVPMLNPDGVIVGNYRANLSGQDLNRLWITATTRQSPEIYQTKQMMKKTINSRQIELYVDLHGHSRKSNVFIYGCNIGPKGN